MNNKIWRTSASPEFDDGLFNRLAAEVFGLDADAVNAELAEFKLNTLENQARLSHWFEVQSPGGRGVRPQGVPPCAKATKKRSRTMAAAAPQARLRRPIADNLVKHCGHSGVYTGILRMNGKRRAAVLSKQGTFGRANTGPSLRPEPPIGLPSSANLDLGVSMTLICDAGLARPVKP